MALNINDIYNFVYVLANKQQSGEITDTDFNTACAFVSLDIFRKETGVPEDYMPNQPVPRMAWQITTTISDDLRFLVKKEIISKANGYFAYPADYGVFSKMRYKYVLNSPNGGTPTSEYRWIEMVTDGEFDLRTSSSIKPPTVFYPICRYDGIGFEVAPSNITQVELTYLKIPTTPVRGFTQLPNDETVYDPLTSVQFEYPETMYPNIAARVALQLGIAIREEQFVEYMQRRKQEGN